MPGVALCLGRAVTKIVGGRAVPIAPGGFWMEAPPDFTHRLRPVMRIVFGWVGGQYRTKDLFSSVWKWDLFHWGACKASFSLGNELLAEKSAFFFMSFRSGEQEADFPSFQCFSAPFDQHFYRHGNGLPESGWAVTWKTVSNSTKTTASFIISRCFAQKRLRPVSGSAKCTFA